MFGNDQKNENLAHGRELKSVNSLKPVISVREEAETLQDKKLITPSYAELQVLINSEICELSTPKLIAKSFAIEVYVKKKT